MIFAWIALGFLGGTVLGITATYFLARKALILLWPSDWLPAIRSRRQKRKLHG